MKVRSAPWSASLGQGRALRSETTITIAVLCIWGNKYLSMYLLRLVPVSAMPYVATLPPRLWAP